MARLLDKIRSLKKETKGHEEKASRSKKPHEDISHEKDGSEEPPKSTPRAEEAPSSTHSQEMNPANFTVEDIQQHFRPYQKHLDDAGVGIKEALPMLLSHYHHAVTDPRDFIQKLAQGIGMRVHIDDASISPEEMEAHADAKKDLDEFSKDKTPREMEKAAPMMSVLIGHGIHDNLPDAYESALWSLPDTREKKLNEIRRGINISRSKMAAKSITSNAVIHSTEKKKPKSWADLRKKS